MKTTPSPILGPCDQRRATTTSMSGESANYFRRKVLIHNAEGKLAEGIFSEIPEVDWPAMGSFSDSPYRLLKGVFKVDRCNQATLSIPSQRRQILLFRLRMKSKRLTCHAAAYVPSAGPLPKRQFLPYRIEHRPDGARPLAARRHPRPGQRSRPLEIKFPASSARSFSGRASAFCSSSWASWVITEIISPDATWPGVSPSSFLIKRNSCRSIGTMGSGGLFPLCLPLTRLVL